MVYSRKWINPSGTMTYYAWRSMRNRCISEGNASWQHYGGRGITFCERWQSYDAFFDDMGECPDDHSLDRIDNNGNYEPSNCKWATIREQLNNQRRSRFIEFNGKKQTLSYWADELGIGPDTLHQRLKRLPVEKALVAGSIKPTWRHGTRAGYESHKCKCDGCKTAHNKRMVAMRIKRNAKATLVADRLLLENSLPTEESL